MLIQNTTSTAASPVHFANDGGIVMSHSTKSDSAPVALPDAASSTQPTVAQLKNAVSDLNQAMQANNSNLAFSIDQDTHQTIVKVLDSKTGETIKQFPSKEAIAIAKAIGDIQHGLLLKHKA